MPYASSTKANTKFRAKKPIKLRAFESDTTERMAPLSFVKRLVCEGIPAELPLVILAATLDFLWDVEDDSGIIIVC